jgi:hypothetical protein
MSINEIFSSCDSRIKISFSETLIERELSFSNELSNELKENEKEKSII